MKDPRIDAYIAKAADFAKPILEHIRMIVHKACPEVTETLKWSMPHFDYKGEMMCSMAAFKGHCVMGFWKASLMKDPMLMDNAASETSMGHLGRITSLKDLPQDKKLVAFIKEAMELNDKGIKVAKKPAAEKKELEIPEELLSALKKNRKARETFEAFSYSHKKEYVEWIAEAKTEPTREKRLIQTIEWLGEGKSRNWKFVKQS
ncbi:YdeI/OmpD-associated family protein [Flavihumibacter solisilvae]|uniref:YdeI/OmpD-associated family protein n=1 Tax=Flavihumibacter solisilvae TaxID=1349421 RepID=UPI0019676055|nr:DUF5655 domain-containing protein [Flavihumibacter solisilvae]